MVCSPWRFLLPWAPRRDQGMNAWSFLNGLKVCLLEFKTQVNNLLLGRTRTDQKITHGRRCLPKIQAKEQASHLPGNTCCCSKGPKVCFLARWEVGRVKKKKKKDWIVDIWICLIMLLFLFPEILMQKIQFLTQTMSEHVKNELGRGREARDRNPGRSKHELFSQKVEGRGNPHISGPKFRKMHPSALPTFFSTRCFQLS